MAYGQKPKCYCNGCSCSQVPKWQLSYGKGSTTIPILVVKFHNRSTAQSLRVGENPLNGKGLPLTDNAEGEEIVCSHGKL